MLLWVTFDTERTDQAVADGTLPTALQDMLDRLRPEAAYFTPNKGRRSCVVVFDLADPSRMPTITEPLFRL
ncbi:MAG TPA: hypothetical protein VI076_12190, partial [Actinopolymorphaceae bacterium]